MQYSYYGKTGKKVSSVGFGGMRFDTKLANEKNAELLLYASEKGINYFDTAPGYCDDKSEDIVGIALKQMPRDSFYISTKFNPENGKCKQDYLDAVKKSIDRLNVDTIDFYHIWCLRAMSHYELAMRPEGQYEALLEAQQQGLINHIVCSSHQSGDEIKTIAEDGKVEGILMGVNILNFPYRLRGLEACSNENLGVVAMNPLGGGAIPQNEEKFQFLCREGETPTEAAIRFCVSNPQINVMLNGFTTKEHIDMACNVAAIAQPFDVSELDNIRKHTGENMNATCTGCGYCLGCPVDINIPAYMQAYNQKQMFGKTDKEMVDVMYGEHHWGTLVDVKATAADCIACGQCETACTQHLNIIERLAEMVAWEEEAAKRK